MNTEGVTIFLTNIIAIRYGKYKAVYEHFFVLCELFFLIITTLAFN